MPSSAREISPVKSAKTQTKSKADKACSKKGKIMIKNAAMHKMRFLRLGYAKLRFFAFEASFIVVIEPAQNHRDDLTSANSTM